MIQAIGDSQVENSNMFTSSDFEVEPQILIWRSLKSSKLEFSFETFLWNLQVEASNYFQKLNRLLEQLFKLIHMLLLI